MFAITWQNVLTHPLPSLAVSEDFFKDCPAAAVRRPQHSIFAALRQVEHANRPPRPGYRSSLN